MLTHQADPGPHLSFTTSDLLQGSQHWGQGRSDVSTPSSTFAPPDHCQYAEDAMTSNTSSTQWPRTANSAFFRPPNHAALPSSKQTPRSCPRQSLSQPSATSTTSSNAAEPPVKRQKGDNEPCKSRSEAHVKSAAANDLHARTTSAQRASDDRSAKGVPGQTILVSSQDKNQILRSGSPLLPLRPSRKPTNGGRSSIRPSAIQRVTSRGNVQNKPYVFEAPPSAPHFRDDGESVLDWKVTRHLAKDWWQDQQISIPGLDTIWKTF